MTSIFSKKVTIDYDNIMRLRGHTWLTKRSTNRIINLLKKDKPNMEAVTKKILQDMKTNSIPYQKDKEFFVATMRTVIDGFAHSVWYTLTYGDHRIIIDILKKTQIKI